MADRRGRADRIGFMRHAQPVFKRVDYLDASARVLLGASGREGVDAAMDEAPAQGGATAYYISDRIRNSNRVRVAILEYGRPNERAAGRTCFF